MSQSPKPSIVLFYSNHCAHCKVLLQEIRQTPLKINLSCIDTLPRQQLPTFLKSVPTLVVSPPLLVLTGDNVFQWLQQQLYEMKEQRQMAQMNVNQIVPQTTNNLSSAPPAEPSAWHMAEMGSTFSDSYSMIGTDCSAQGLGGNNITHSFAFLNAPMGNSSIPSSSPNNNNNNANMKNTGTDTRQSQKVAELNSKMERLKAERDMQNSNIGMMGRF